MKPKVKLLDRFRRSSDAEPDGKDSKTFQDKAIPMEVIEIQKHVQPIYKITGTKNSCKHTMTKFSNRDEKWANVHTAEDEGCSWVLLLDALQGQEKASRAWDRADELGAKHTICYLIQRKRRCWDFIPLNVTKPFATTTICHLVEMMSMLGLIWKEFDVRRSSLSAEGNGYMLRGEYVLGLGILTRFFRLSKPEHSENRIIPCNEIKRLCFGEVPSLFDTIDENLRVGPGRLEYCLKRLLPDLDDTHRNTFLDPIARLPRPLMFPSKFLVKNLGSFTYHILVTFELIAMLAKSVHLQGSRFRRLPNPCAESWTPGLKMAVCLSAFGTEIKNRPSLGSGDLTKEIQGLFEHGRIDGYNLPDGQTLLQMVEAYSEANICLATVDTIYHPPDKRQIMKDDAVRDYDTRLRDLLDALHKALERVDDRLKPMVKTPEFREVIALHLSTIIDQQAALNEKLADATGDNSKEKILINFYLNNIHPAAVKESAKAADGEATAEPVISRSGTSSEEVTLSATPNERSDIWVGLMFRMWSWLFLHDFNPEDKMIERSEFQDNRLPVYIG